MRVMYKEKVCCVTKLIFVLISSSSWVDRVPRKELWVNYFG
jgi:hypothetical protein